MKKISIVFISIILISLFVGCTNGKERKYSSNSGRDTVISLGDNDGRFLVVRGVTESFEHYWDLFDVKNQDSLGRIDNYKDIKPYIYTIGKNGYTKLNYENGEYIQSKNLIDFTDSDIKIFKELKSEKIPKKD